MTVKYLCVMHMLVCSSVHAWPACLLVLACARAAGCADLMTLDTMSPQERKRQGYIHEVIQTEETYVEDLELVLEVRTYALKRNMQNLLSAAVSNLPVCIVRSSTGPCPSRAG